MSRPKGPIHLSEGKQFSVYNGGELNRILTKDLVNNEVAIKQLINEYNLKSAEIIVLREREIELKAELDHQKTSPFYAIISAVMNIIGTIIVGYGINRLSSKTDDFFLVLLGGVIVLVSNIQTVCHRWVRQWFASLDVPKSSNSSLKKININDNLT